MKSLVLLLSLLPSLCLFGRAQAETRSDVRSDSAEAASADIEGLRSLIHARSSSQLTKRVSDRKRQSHDHLVCESELRTGKLPVACFRYVSHGENDESETHSFSWLEQLCRDRARASKDRRDLQRAENESSLPTSCREIARGRAADLRYADETERPAELFGRLTERKKP